MQVLYQHQPEFKHSGEKKHREGEEKEEDECVQTQKIISKKERKLVIYDNFISGVKIFCFWSTLHTHTTMQCISSAR